MVFRFAIFFLLLNFCFYCSLGAEDLSEYQAPPHLSSELWSTQDEATQWVGPLTGGFLLTSSLGLFYYTWSQLSQDFKVELNPVLVRERVLTAAAATLFLGLATVFLEPLFTSSD